MSGEQPTKKRIRKRSLRIQLESALRSAEAAMLIEASDELAISRIKLAQTRLVVLNQAAGRERHDKLRKLKADNERLFAENNRLKSELTSLRQAESPRASSDLDAQAQEMVKRLQNGADNGAQIQKN